MNASKPITEYDLGKFSSSVNLLLKSSMELGLVEVVTQRITEVCAVRDAIFL